MTQAPVRGVRNRSFGSSKTLSGPKLACGPNHFCAFRACASRRSAIKSLASAICNHGSLEAFKSEYVAIGNASVECRIGPLGVDAVVLAKSVIAISNLSRYCKESVVNFGILHPQAVVSVPALPPILLIRPRGRSMQMHPAARH